MKCSEWLIHIGFTKSHEPDKIKNLTVAQPALDEALGGGDKLMTKYSLSGRFIVVRCKLSKAAYEKTGGTNGHSTKMLRLSKRIIEAFPAATDIDIFGYYVNNHRTCQWKWIYDAKTDVGRLALIPVYLQNKMCCTDMTIDKFSAYLADWIDRMTGQVIGAIE